MHYQLACGLLDQLHHVLMDRLDIGPCLCVTTELEVFKSSVTPTRTGWAVGNQVSVVVRIDPIYGLRGFYSMFGQRLPAPKSLYGAANMSIYFRSDVIECNIYVRGTRSSSRKFSYYDQTDFESLIGWCTDELASAAKTVQETAQVKPPLYQRVSNFCLRVSGLIDMLTK